MSAEDFQTKYAAIMESALKSSIAETTKLFKTMIDELKAEMSSIKRENEELKIRCRRIESARGAPSAESEPLPGRSRGSEKRDTAVQCDLFPYRTMLVEQCQPLRPPSLENQKQQCPHEAMEYALQDHNYEAHEAGDSQMESILVKREEEVDSIVLCEPGSRDEADVPRASACGIETERPFTNSVRSSREIPSPRRQEEALEQPQQSQNQSSELEHSLVISLTVKKDDMREESEVSQMISDTGTQGDLVTSEQHQLVVDQYQSEVGPRGEEQPSVVPQQQQRKGEMSVNEHTDITLQQHADVPPRRKQLPEPMSLNKGENCEELKNGATEVEASSPSDLSVRRRRGRPPKKPKNLQQLAKQIDPENKKVDSQTVDTSCSPEKDKISASQLLSAVDMEEGTVQDLSTEDFSAKETQNPPPTKSPKVPSVQPRQHLTSASLQDAMLLVEAMNQTTEENTCSSPKKVNAAPQTQHASSMGALANVDEAPAEQQMLDPQLLVATDKSKGNLPATKPSTTVQSVKVKPSASPQTIKVVVPRQQHTVSPTRATQTSVSSLKQQHPLIAQVAPIRHGNSVPQKIIVMRRPVSSVMPHKSASLGTAHLPTVMSTVVVTQNKDILPSPTTAGSPLRTPCLSFVPQKKIYVMSSKSLPVGTQSTTTSTDAQAGTALPKKLIIIPRQLSAVAARTEQSHSIVLPAQQQLAKSASTAAVSLSQEFSASMEMQVALDEAANISSQMMNKASDNLESPKRTGTLNLFQKSTKEPVLVSGLATNGLSDSQSNLKDGTMQEKSPVVIVAQPSEMLVSSTLNTSKIKRYSSLSSENYRTVEESPNTTGVQLSTPLMVSRIVFEKSTVNFDPTKPSTVSDRAGEPSNLDEEIISTAMQDGAFSIDQTMEEQSALKNLTSVTCGDTADPHVQMTKNQFLAQLAVSPVSQDPQKASTIDSVDVTASCAGNGISDKKLSQKNVLLAQLQSHIKSYLQARRTETNPESHIDSDVQTVSPKKIRLENDHPNEKIATAEPIDSSQQISGAVEDVTSLNNTSDDSNPISPRGSGICKDVEPTQSVFSPTEENVSPKTSPNYMRPRRSSSSTPNYTNPPSARPKRTGSKREATSTLVSPRTPSLRRNGTSPKTPTNKSTTVRHSMITVRKDSSSLKQIKTRSSSSGSGIYSTTITDGGSAKQTKSKTNATNAQVAKDSNSSDQSGQSTPKGNLRLVNAKNLAKAAKAKTIVKMNEAKACQSAEQDAVTKYAAKAVWTPPKVPTSKAASAAGKMSVQVPVKKDSKSQEQTAVYPPSVSLHPIPVKGPPIESPSQPLSVIGWRLLKNQCGECGLVLSSSATLETHVGLHKVQQPFSCRLCGKRFQNAKCLKRHDRVHRNGRIHVCQQCGKGFVYRFALTKHLQVVHSRIKPFVCQICNKGFFSKRDVESHIRIHTGEKPFHCNLCEKKFTRRVELNLHLRRHNGEKRHWCTYCGKGFLDFNNLKRHKYIHTGERPHSCPHCPKNFIQSGHMKKHIKNVHKIQ